MKTYSKTELKEKAKAVFAQYPKINTLLVTSDRQCFDAINSQSTDYHCKYNASKKELTITTFHRTELDSEMIIQEQKEIEKATETVQESESTVLEKTEEMETVQESEDSLTDESTVLEQKESTETTEDLESIKEALPPLPLKQNNPKRKKP